MGRCMAEFLQRKSETFELVDLSDKLFAIITHYISPSILPSRSANSVHVVMQCEALINNGADLVLYARRAIPKDEDLTEAILSAYGVDLHKARIVSFYSRFNLATNLRIAVHALWDLMTRKWPDALISRNLYASFLIGFVMRRPVLFETHQLEIGFRKLLQRGTMSCPWVTTIVVSNKLKYYLEQHHGIGPARTLVLHDAAPDGIEPIPRSARRDQLIQALPGIEGHWESICGYFGHLYPGRGVEVIEEMAKARPHVLFLLFGGNEADVLIKKKSNQLTNLIYIGHVSHQVAQQAMCSVDVLLMPYQENVSIGVAGHDTARWMSPMKMFEYMAAGVPIISSDLPVLREVLINKHNALLVSPSDPKKWCNALDLLSNDSEFANFLGKQAHSDYLENYTWGIRARAILSLLD
jgi:glycosyltransferase involved in cell wall biosynthesis